MDSAELANQRREKVFEKIKNKKIEYFNAFGT